MFVRMTFNKDDPAAVEVAIAMYTSEEVSGVVRRQKGHRFHYLLRSADDPTQSVSVNAWDSREDAEAYVRSGAYQETRGEVRPTYHTEPSRLRSYEDLGGGAGPEKGPGAYRTPALLLALICARLPREAVSRQLNDALTRLLVSSNAMPCGYPI